MYKNIQVSGFKDFNKKVPTRSKTIDIVFLCVMFLVLTSPLMIFLVNGYVGVVYNNKTSQDKSNNIALITTKTVNSNVKTP